MRMAALMQLHREDTYHCENPTKEWVVNAESARRTLVCQLASLQHRKWLDRLISVQQSFSFAD